MSTVGKWLAIEVEAGVVHLVPTGDLIAHEMTDDCPCGPSSECVQSPDAADGWLIEHMSLDGRESEEAGCGKDED